MCNPKSLFWLYDWGLCKDLFSLIYAIPCVRVSIPVTVGVEILVLDAEKLFTLGRHFPSLIAFSNIR